MAGMNECINTNGDIHDFYIENDIIDAVVVLNPTLKMDETCLHGGKQKYYICIFPALSSMAIKADCHQFNQYFISGH